MVERYAISQYEQAARLLPVRWQRIALQLPDWQKEQAEELRLRAGHPMTVLLPRGEQVVGEEAVVTHSGRHRAAVRYGDGLFPLCRRGDHGPVIHNRQRRLSHRLVRHCRRAGGQEHQSSQPVLRLRSHCPGNAGPGR